MAAFVVDVVEQASVNRAMECSVLFTVGMQVTGAGLVCLCTSCVRGMRGETH